MALEIEKKYRITAGDRERVKSTLNEFNAEYEGTDFEENTIYGGSKLNEIGGILRIRRMNGKAIFTFKKSVQDQTGAKTRIEHESEIGSPDDIAEILDELGFTKQLVYEKRRETWKFRSVEVVLDELPFGLFMEIEGSITAIREAEMLLDVEDLEVVQESYPRLTVQKGIKRDGVVEARFVDASDQAA